MFQIDIAPKRKTASALTVLAAIGASGTVAEFASADVAELAPVEAARGKNSTFIGTNFPENWMDWLADTGVTYHAEGPAFARWNIDFGLGPISSATYRIDANGASDAYGIPAGAVLDFALVTEPWSAATPDTSNTGPDVGTTLGTDFVQITAPGGDIDVDITPLLTTWQASPAAYYGVRFKVSGGAQRGGVQAPNATGITADLVLDQVVPEPASFSLMALGGLMLLRRRRKS